MNSTISGHNETLEVHIEVYTILQLLSTGISTEILRAVFPGKPLRYFLLLSSTERTRRKSVQFLLHGEDQSLL